MFCYLCQYDRMMVRPKGFEPSAFGSGGQRSIQLSYGRLALSTEVNITDQNATRQVFFFIFILLAAFINKSTLIRVIDSTTSKLIIEYSCYTYNIATSSFGVNHTLGKPRWITPSHTTGRI